MSVHVKSHRRGKAIVVAYIRGSKVNSTARNFVRANPRGQRHSLSSSEANRMTLKIQAHKLRAVTMTVKGRRKAARKFRMNKQQINGTF